MLMTQRAKTLWVESFQTPVRLPPELETILNSNFVELYGCCVLETMVPADLAKSKAQACFSDLPEVLRLNVQDRTGFEHFIAKLHIDGLVKSHHFEYAFEFLMGVFRLFQKQYPQRILRGMIMLDEGTAPEGIFSCCVSYHVLREGESWLAPDVDVNIDQYGDVLLVIDSNEAVIIPRLSGNNL